MKQNLRRRVLRISVLLTYSLTALSLGSCGREFRQAAGPSVQSGVSQILNGLVDGFFAAVEPDPVAGSNG